MIFPSWVRVGLPVCRASSSPSRARATAIAVFFLGDLDGVFQDLDFQRLPSELTLELANAGLELLDLGFRDDSFVCA